MRKHIDPYVIARMRSLELKARTVVDGFLVGIHKSTIFHYFKNKEELLLVILRISIQEVTKILELILEDNSLSPGEKLRHAIDNHLELLAKYRNNARCFDGIFI